MRINRLLALLVALLLGLSTVALADPCALCGRESGSDAYLCTACLLELLTKEEDLSGGLTLEAPVVNPDGTVTLSWADKGGKGPYTVRYELLEAAPVPFGWTAATDVTETTCTLTQLVPGVSYVFIVSDSEGNQVECVYYAPVPAEGNEIGARIRFKTMRREQSVRRNTQRSFSAEEISGNPGKYEFGLYLRLTYSVLARTRNYAFGITVEAPNGFSDVILSGGLELLHGRSAVPVWGFISLGDYFACLQDYYGGIPTGEYKVTMHFNGNPACSDTFTVVE